MDSCRKDDLDWPAPDEGFAITNFLVVSDVASSAKFNQDVFGAKLIMEGEATILKLANTWMVLNIGGGPTDDKPTVHLDTPDDPDKVSAFLNIRVAEIHQCYAEWNAKGAQFLTPVVEHEQEWRGYIRDPDGHLIEVGQAKPLY